MSGGMAGLAGSHGELMNAVYRRQRWIYDASRKYFLFGRDHLIAHLDPPEGGRVLEIGCGTGRNLDLIGRRHPGARRFGLDISSEMLRSARKKLGESARLAEGDACGFDAGALFGEPVFERVVFSYALSMIPDWTRALEEAAGKLAPGGELHVVDFGRQERLPGWFRKGLAAWLGKFHVTPRTDLEAVLGEIAAETGAEARWEALHGSYAQYGVLRRP